MAVAEGLNQSDLATGASKESVEYLANRVQELERTLKYWESRRVRDAHISNPTPTRAATDCELSQIMDYYENHEMAGMDEADCIPPYIVVIDHYMTGSPGYSGPMIITAWDASPDYVDVFTEHHKTGALTRILSGGLLEGQEPLDYIASL